MLPAPQSERAHEIAAVLGPGGSLCEALPNYEVRPQQLAMANEVWRALDERRPLVVEAGTGTGKTMAYLVPAILSGLKVVISTGTKNLQEQIYKKDLVLLRSHLPRAFSAAYLKGISNYLCQRRYREFVSAETVRSKEIDRGLHQLADWASRTETGDRGELRDLPDDSPLWREVSATSETRQGQRCAHYESCFVTRTRREAQKADIIVVNHHLFFADLALRNRWPEARILPAYEAVIFDEAHQLEDVACDYFGVSLSTGRVTSLLRDVERGLRSGNVSSQLRETVAHVERRAELMFQALRDKLGDKERVLVTADTWRGPEKEAHAFDNALEELAAGMAAHASDAADHGDEADSLALRATALRDDLGMLVDGAQKIDRHHVFWAETRGRGVFLRASPIDVSSIIREKVLGETDAAIFTSATLSEGGSFDFVRARLGLESAMEARFPSPFDYSQQAVLYLPTDLPEPADPGFTAAVADRMYELCQLTSGRAFLLFTSHRQLDRVHQILKKRLTQPILVQGEQPKHLLLEEFRRNIGSVLFATASFWEGVDVVGEALSLVVIDKLPFAPPDDPLVEARSARLNEQGLDAFVHYHLPSAALALAQGFGRLIRHRQDRGIVALLDRRASTKRYGRRVLSSLPENCPRVSELDQVKKFWTA